MFQQHKYQQFIVLRLPFVKYNMIISNSNSNTLDLDNEQSQYDNTAQLKTLPFVSK